MVGEEEVDKPSKAELAKADAGKRRRAELEIRIASTKMGHEWLLRVQQIGKGGITMETDPTADESREVDQSVEESSEQTPQDSPPVESSTGQPPLQSDQDDDEGYDGDGPDDAD